jgi:K(+)-stimulated pyrophosphate-energized sodium pump
VHKKGDANVSLVEISIGLALLAIVYGFVVGRWVLGSEAGNQTMQDIAGAIQEGAQAYLKRQYTAIAGVGVAVAVIVYVFLGAIPAVGFVIGATLSGATGFIGMNVSVRANVRTAAAAQRGLQAGLTLAFLIVAALAGWYMFYAAMTGVLSPSAQPAGSEYQIPYNVDPRFPF